MDIMQAYLIGKAEPNQQFPMRYPAGKYREEHRDPDMLVAKCCAHVFRRGDKRMWSCATQHVHSTALHQLLLRQPGRLLQQVAWGGVAPNDATREPGAFC